MATEFLSIGGLTLRVTDFERGEPETGGTLHPTLSGQLRGAPLWSARRWTCTLYAETDAEAEAMHALAASFTPHAASGAALPAAMGLHVRVTRDTHARDGEGWYRMLSVELREAL